MAIRLPLELEELNFLVGCDFPEADEDALWRCAQAWAAAAAELRRLNTAAAPLGPSIVGALGGEIGGAFRDLWRRLAGEPDAFINQLATACECLAEACDRTAVEVEYAKIQYIAALIVLGVTIAALLAMVWAGGISAAGVPVAIAAAHITIRLVLTRLLTAAAIGAGLNVALDGVAQAVQFSSGHREDWDWSKTRRAAEDGAIFGAVGGGVFLAGGRLAPGLMRSPAGPLGGTGVTGAVGAVAAPLAHGEVPTGRDFLLAVSSGLAGGLGPDLSRGAPRPGSPAGAPMPDLSRLGSLDASAGHPPDLSASVGPSAPVVNRPDLSGRAQDPIDVLRPVPPQAERVASQPRVLDPPPLAAPTSVVSASTPVGAEVAPPWSSDGSETRPGGGPDHSVDWDLSDAEAIDLVRANVFATESGLAFYPVGDEVRDFARAVRPAAGFVTLDLHGSPAGFFIDEHMISPAQFAGALRALRDGGLLSLPHGAGLKLLSCDTAVGGPDSPAATLARELGVQVIAPDQPVWTTLDGEEVVASTVVLDGNLMPVDPPDGDWHTFAPGGAHQGIVGDRSLRTVDLEPRSGESAMPRAPTSAADGGGPGLDPRDLAGRDPDEIMAGIPVDWVSSPSRSGKGVVFRDPACPGRQIRIMPGYVDGNRPDPLTHGPYAIISQNGITMKVPLLGNPTLDGADG